MNVYEESRLTLQCDGFVVLRQFLPPSDLQELTDSLDAYIRTIVPGLPDSSAFYHDRRRPETLKQMQHFQQAPSLTDYPMRPQWLEMAAGLLGESVVSMGPEWFNKPPGVEHPTPPHQDNFYFKLSPPQVITAWLALDPADEANGCLRYVPGSHQLGLRPHAATKVLGFSQGITDYGPDDDAREVAVPLQPGDLAVHHGETIHLADANHSATRQRRAFAMVYRGVSARLDGDAKQQHQDEVTRQHVEFGLQPRDA
ncbi:MAG: phytanoyl-CoA dioxygenase family protein [Planctomycetota bacterium]|nr:phytanoyl-CoA dioxygenase family protein [Planctomycetota bacterium]